MIDTIVGGLRDCVFFLVVGFLGFHKIIGEPILAALLSAYTAHRFGVSMGKQQAVIALGSSSGGGGGGGGTGGSGTMRATVDPSAQPTRRIDTRTLAPVMTPDNRGAPAPREGQSSPIAPVATSLHLDTGAYQTVVHSVGGIG